MSRRSAHIGLLAALLPSFLMIQSALAADFFSLHSWYRQRGETVVVAVRQEVDFARSFDRFYLEEHLAPANTRRSSHELGDGKRELWLKLGQFELYRAGVEKALADGLDKLKGRKPRPVSTLAGTTGLTSFAFEVKGIPLALELTGGERREEMVLVRRDDDRRYSLVRIPGAGAGEEGTVAGRSFGQVALVEDGQMLAVVVREQRLPSPRFGPSDRIFFFPLKRAATRLGLPYPLLQPEETVP